MPGVVRVGDGHAGHASPTPNPFHQTSYASGSPDVFTNGKATVRVGDATGCGDPAASGSPTVFVNGIPVHRLGDGTGGHGSWVPNSAASCSGNVFANGSSGSGTPPDPAAAIAAKNECQYFDWNNNTCLDQNTDPDAPYYTG
jgi:uncharacterized Zn-binding protein involved in type VI secretion